MSPTTFDDRELQQLLVALRYWRTHRADGATRRNDPALGPDFVDLLISKLTSALPPGERDVRQRGLFSAEQPVASANDAPAAAPPPERKPGPRR